MHNNHLSNLKQLVSESLDFKEMEGLIKPTVHIDEFSSKMGDDDDVIVISFFVRDPAAAKDLMNWFEKGYDFVIDADKSPGEIKPNRYLGYVEIRRRSTAGSHVETLLTEFKDSSDWTMHYQGKETPFTRDEFDRQVPLSPKQYRERVEKDLNEMRTAAGLPVNGYYDPKDRALQAIQSAAGLI